jgi:predicted nucleic acid-binding protein
MTTEVFTDSGPLYAFFDAGHPRHGDAVRLFTGSPPLVTTNVVLAEVIGLAAVRREPDFTVRLAERLVEGRLARIERVTAADEVLALRFLRRFAAQGATFADCTSFAVIVRLELAVVFSFDRHFAPPGFFRLEPAQES